MPIKPRRLPIRGPLGGALAALALLVAAGLGWGATAAFAQFSARNHGWAHSQQIARTPLPRR